MKPSKLYTSFIKEFEIIATYSHLREKDARKIIELHNKKFTRLQIAELLNISYRVVKRCIEQSKLVEKSTKKNNKQPWKNVVDKVTYTITEWNRKRENIKKKRKKEWARLTNLKFALFIAFVKDHFQNKKVAGECVKRSANDWIDKFKNAHPSQPFPSKSTIYEMAKNKECKFSINWLPSTKVKKEKNKSKDESRKGIKYNSIENRPPKSILRSEYGHYEIDSVIGKKSDKYALITLLEIKTGKLYIDKYNRTKKGFRDSLKRMIARNQLHIKTLTMDNGGENNLLHEVIDRSKLYNCHLYCSGEKGTLENKHRFIRRVYPKGVSFNNIQDWEIREIEVFIWNYYCPKFNLTLN